MKKGTRNITQSIAQSMWVHIKITSIFIPDGQFLSEILTKTPVFVTSKTIFSNFKQLTEN